DSGLEYYPSRRLPEELLEEVHGEDGALIAAVTRNRYGAAVLNTDALLICDVDRPPEDVGRSRPRIGRAGKRPGLLSRLLGGGATHDTARETSPGEPAPRGADISTGGVGGAADGN
uniref:hypothetical protein n=1 Tax=Picosynechococcus sp. (strain ATCC 27264 / PCC 7002 / PR-6) TaxID=32049 RepID=UPI001C3D5E17